MGIWFRGGPTDDTPPAITADVDNTLGNNGWYTSDVTVTWTVTDDESDVTITAGCVDQDILLDTAGLTFTCDAESAGNSASEEVTIKRDTTAPTVQSNAPETIVPPDALISFTATAADTGSGNPVVTITSFECWAINGAGKRIDKSESCVVSIDGATITILDSGGVGDHIEWTITAIDDAGNISDPEAKEATSVVVVVNPGNGCGNGGNNAGGNGRGKGPR